ncbi:hypothetical protein PR048_032967 [Dryococelus australis]|uniref:HAT C-terminal dimerisation domain-containing protein n=1 Tax=Dryococelus australis TaxID=614101 RepID=A0ABQ9G7U6_9NEOP|nr:hypothetical protein PR048_032967 [Dryococelus australis]
MSRMKCLNQIKVLDCDQWPADLPVGYGEEEIQNLCTSQDKKTLTGPILTINNHCISKELNELINCTKLILCSSAEYERGFSLMNIFLSPTRNRLLIPHVYSLMFIKLCRPSLKDWNSEPYISAWLRLHHSADDTRTRVAKDAEKNVYANL